jgi:hypothetical protein
VLTSTLAIARRPLLRQASWKVSYRRHTPDRRTPLSHYKVQEPPRLRPVRPQLLQLTLYSPGYAREEIKQHHRFSVKCSKLVRERDSEQCKLDSDASVPVGQPAVM